MLHKTRLHKIDLPFLKMAFAIKMQIELRASLDLIRFEEISKKAKIGPNIISQLGGGEF